MSDKTELRAAIDAAVHELASMLPKNKTLSDAGHLIVGDIIERHIAPLLQSARAAAIEECVEHQPIAHENNDEIYITCRCGWDARKQEHTMIEVETAWQKHIRALKEKP